MKLCTPIAGYAELLDRVRRYYATREGDNANAAFSATMLLAALATLNVVSISLCIDLIVYRDLRFAGWVRAHRHVAVLIPIGIAGIHFWFAKWSGVYDRRGSRDTSSMPSELRWYGAATVLFFAAILLAIKILRV